jgi:hypothetical protein
LGGCYWQTERRNLSPTWVERDAWYLKILVRVEGEKAAATCLDGGRIRVGTIIATDMADSFTVVS